MESRISRSRQARKAARVLPEPVGAVMRASCPAPMMGQAPCWAGVGPAKRRRNQVSSTGWNICSVYLRRRPRQGEFFGSDRRAAQKTIELGGPVIHAVLHASRCLELARGEHAAAERVLVEGTAEHGLVDLLQLQQGEGVAKELEPDGGGVQLAPQALDRHA